MNGLPETSGPRRRLQETDYRALVADLQRAIDEREAFKAVWLLACVSEPLRARLTRTVGGQADVLQELVAQTVHEVLRDRPDGWTFYCPIRDDGQRGGTYYFRDRPRFDFLDGGLHAGRD